MRGTNALACVTLAGMVVLVGCGTVVAGRATAGGNGTASPGAPTVLTSAVALPANGKAATVAQLGQLIAAGAGAKGTAHFTVRTTGFTKGTATGVVRFGQRLTVDETADRGAMSQVGLVMANDKTYVKVPADLMQAMQVPGPPWFTVDPKGTKGLSQMLGGILGDAQRNIDPAVLINSIATKATITATTKEQLNGQTVTHYAITVDLGKSAGATIQSTPDATGHTDTLIEPSSRTVDYWVDADYLPARYTSTTTTADPMGMAPTQDTVTATYTGWGQPVTITPPPAGQINTAPHN